MQAFGLRTRHDRAYEELVYELEGVPLEVYAKS